MQIRVIATAAIAKKVHKSTGFERFINNSLDRHFSGDQGEVSEDDSATNTSDPLYVLSAYTDPNGVKIWIKQDYNVVTVLFPFEYQPKRSHRWSVRNDSPRCADDGRREMALL